MFNCLLAEIRANIACIVSVLQVRNMANLCSADPLVKKIRVDRPIMKLDGKNNIRVCILLFYDTSIF